MCHSQGLKIPAKKKRSGVLKAALNRDWKFHWSSLEAHHDWLVVLTILKNISQWEGLSHILWKITNVWNHQPTNNHNLLVGVAMSTLDFDNTDYTRDYPENSRKLLRTLGHPPLFVNWGAMHRRLALTWKHNSNHVIYIIYTIVYINDSIHIVQYIFIAMNRYKVVP